YQWQSRPTCGGSAWTDIPGATNANYIVNTLSGPTEFRVYIVCNPSSLADTSGGYVVTALPMNYCASGAMYPYDEVITNVTIDNMSNSSVCGSIGGPGSIVDQYSDYTSLVAPPPISKGSSVPFSVTVGSCGTYTYSSGLAMWVDFNANGTFE